MAGDWLKISEGQEPVVAAAIHDGHELRPEVAKLVALSESDRLREEDPFTGTWTTIVGTRVIPTRSRFEVDLNRPRAMAVYRTPADAWGLKVWRREPSRETVANSLHQYDQFYAAMHEVLTNVKERCGRFVLLDLHTYNHRRGGPESPPDDPSRNPEVNLGTGTMDRSRWGALVDRFKEDLAGFDFPGRKLDVRENVRFRGRPPVEVGPRKVPGFRVLPRHRVQEVLHGRVDGGAGCGGAGGDSSGPGGDPPRIDPVLDPGQGVLTGAADADEGVPDGG